MGTGKAFWANLAVLARKHAATFRLHGRLESAKEMDEAADGAERIVEDMVANGRLRASKAPRGEAHMQMMRLARQRKIQMSKQRFESQ
jgi:hypothetical protein